MNELVRAFRERLSGPEQEKEGAAPPGSAVVFLDALDQLNPTDNARMLYWLPRELAPGVKVVISVLETDSPDGEGGKHGEFDCFDIARRIWPESLARVGLLGVADGQALLQIWLGEAGRTLQDTQRNDLLAKFERDGRPLYLRVAFEEARLRKWWQPGF